MERVKPGDLITSDLLNKIEVEIENLLQNTVKYDNYWNVGIGTTSPENGEGWSKVLDILGDQHSKLSLRTSNIDARVLVHNIGWWSAPAE